MSKPRISQAARALRAKLSKRREKKEKEFDSWGNPVYKPLMVSDFYLTKEWKEVRFEAFRLNAAKNSDGKAHCEVCGAGWKPGNPLQADHLKSRHFFPSLELAQSNIGIKCKSCNQGKGSKSDI